MSIREACGLWISHCPLLGELLDCPPPALCPKFQNKIRPKFQILHVPNPSGSKDMRLVFIYDDNFINESKTSELTAVCLLLVVK